LYDKVRNEVECVWRVSVALFCNPLFQESPLDMLLTISNLATTCELAVVRVLLDCLLNIC